MQISRDNLLVHLLFSILVILNSLTFLFSFSHPAGQNLAASHGPGSGVYSNFDPNTIFSNVEMGLHEGAGAGSSTMNQSTAAGGGDDMHTTNSELLKRKAMDISGVQE